MMKACAVTARGAIGTLLLAASLTQASATPAADVARRLAGAWDISAADGKRQCRLVLRGDVEADRFALAMPAGCRRALPALATIGAWAPADDGGLSFDDRSGTPILAFSPHDGTLEATGPTGEGYRLVPAKPAQPVGDTPTERPVLVAATTTAPAAAPARPLDRAALPGRYAILRDGGKDTNCMLTFDPSAKGKGGNKAVLSPACRDQGIVIFDPVGWRVDGTHLVLTARKGHSTTFAQGVDGVWQKDPPEGKGLGLKKF